MPPEPVTLVEAITAIRNHVLEKQDIRPHNIHQAMFAEPAQVLHDVLAEDAHGDGIQDGLDDPTGETHSKGDHCEDAGVEVIYRGA